MEDASTVKYLLEQYFANIIDDSERVALLAIADKNPLIQELLEKIDNNIFVDAEFHSFLDTFGDQEAQNRIWVSVNQKIRALSHPPSLRQIRFWLVRAAIALLIGTTAIIIWTSKRSHDIQQTREDIAPGGNKATLTWADGQTIDLNETQKGIVMGEGVTYLDGTTVVERRDKPSKDLATQYAVLATPRGGTYQITLPDGTKVWLNAASTLKYPIRFTADARTVELTGEAYFEVSEQWRKAGTATAKKMPFIVKSQDQVVDVLGTHFNVNNYEDEPMAKTTLLEGSVRVRPLMDASSGHNKSCLIKPGQQSIVSGSDVNVMPVDVEKVIDWKNGDFIFQEDNLAEIMNKIARWYDVEVVYEPEIDREQTFSGQMSRSKHLSEILKNLKITGHVNFKIQGRVVYVTR